MGKREVEDFKLPRTLHRDNSESTKDILFTERGDLRGTHAWTQHHCDLFRLAYSDVPLGDWEDYICAKEHVPPCINMFAKWKTSTKDIIDQKHLNEGSEFRKLGDKIFATLKDDHVECASGALALFILDSCIEDDLLKEVVVFPSILQYNVSVGHFDYASIPDGGLFMRESAVKPAAIFIVLEDAKSPRPLCGKANKEYQVLGEMLAAAPNNAKTLGTHISQTVFALRVKGSCFVFYRMDVPYVYFSEFKGEDAPFDLTVMRYGGDHTHDGFDIAEPGKDRKEVFRILTSIIAFCGRKVVPAIQNKVVADATQERIDWLYGEPNKESKQH